jgi:inosine/xanthosine triphosphatase
MKTVVIASSNPVKIKAVRGGFERMFPEEKFDFIGINTISGVSDQPNTDLETLQGAIQRAQNARRLKPETDYCVGVEGGISNEGDEMIAFAWVAVLSGSRLGKARTAAFFLPKPIAALVRQGKELGEADDIFFGRINSKQEDGAIGILTGKTVDRAALYEQAVILALARFKNPAFFPDE